jgi:hypothetical protein
MATADITQLSQELGQLTRVLRDMVAASSRTVAAQQANYMSQLDVNEQLEEYKKQMTQGKALTKKQNQLLDEATKLKKKEIAAEKEYAKAVKENLALLKRRNVSDSDKANSARKVLQTQRALSTASTNSAAATSALTSSMGGLVKGTNFAGAALMWFGSTLKTAISHAKDQIVANQGMVEGTGSLIGALAKQQDEALKFGLSGADFAKTISENRQMVNAMGGTSAATKQVESSMLSFYAMTGDRSVAFAALTESMTSFAQKGVKPTQSVLESYTADVKTLAAQTGMNQQAARAFYDDIANDVNSIDMLRSARTEDRAALLQNQRDLVQHSIAIGMSAEQAKEAAKMMNKMVGAKPLDRLKQAAKIRALGGAMGISGAEEAAKAVSMGKRGTPEQQKANQEAIAKFSTAMANRMDQAAQQGLGSEIFATQLVDKLGLEDLYGKGSAFSTTLGDTLAKPLAEVKAAYVDASKDIVLKMGYHAELLYDQAKLIVSGTNYLGPIAAGVAAIGAMLLGGKAMDLLGKGAGKLLGKMGGAAGTAGKAAGTVAEGAAGAAGTVGKAAGTAGKAAGVLGKAGTLLKGAGVAGAVLDAGMGVNDLMQGKAQTEIPSGMDMISPMRWGLYAGDKINKGAEGLMGGQSIGSKVYDWMNPGAGAALTQPTTPKKDDKAAEAAKKASDSAEATKKATLSSADGIAAQVKQMDTSNDFLKRIADMTEQQLTLAEKQLVAMTMTDTEKTNSDSRSKLRSDNKFGAQYNYV